VCRRTRRSRRGADHIARSTAAGGARHRLRALDPRQAAGLDLDTVRAGWVDEITASGVYGPVHVGQFPRHARYSRAGCVDLLATYSDHAVLPAPDRAALFEAIGAAIDRRGGSIDVRTSR
jgi:hypothetical protein